MEAFRHGGVDLEGVARRGFYDLVFSLYRQRWRAKGKAEPYPVSQFLGDWKRKHPF